MVFHPSSARSVNMVSADTKVDKNSVANS